MSAFWNMKYLQTNKTCILTVKLDSECRLKSTEQIDVGIPRKQEECQDCYITLDVVASMIRSSPDKQTSSEEVQILTTEQINHIFTIKIANIDRDGVNIDIQFTSKFSRSDSAKYINLYLNRRTFASFDIVIGCYAATNMSSNNDSQSRKKDTIKTRIPFRTNSCNKLSVNKSKKKRKTLCQSEEIVDDSEEDPPEIQNKKQKIKTPTLLNPPNTIPSNIFENTDPRVYPTPVCAQPQLSNLSITNLNTQSSPNQTFYNMNSNNFDTSSSKNNSVDYNILGAKDLVENTHPTTPSDLVLTTIYPDKAYIDDIERHYNQTQSNNMNPNFLARGKKLGRSALYFDDRVITIVPSNDVNGLEQVHAVIPPLSKLLDINFSTAFLSDYSCFITMRDCTRKSNELVFTYLARPAKDATELVRNIYTNNNIANKIPLESPRLSDTSMMNISQGYDFYNNLQTIATNIENILTNTTCDYILSQIGSDNRGLLHYLSILQHSDDIFYNVRDLITHYVKSLKNTGCEDYKNYLWKDNLGCTPMHYAVWTGNYDMCHLLLELDSDLYVKDCNGYTIYDLFNKVEGYSITSKEQLQDFLYDQVEMLEISSWVDTQIKMNNYENCIKEWIVKTENIIRIRKNTPKDQYKLGRFYLQEWLVENGCVGKGCEYYIKCLDIDTWYGRHKNTNCILKSKIPNKAKYVVGRRHIENAAHDNYTPAKIMMPILKLIDSRFTEAEKLISELVEDLSYLDSDCIEENVLLKKPKNKGIIYYTMGVIMDIGNRKSRAFENFYEAALAGHNRARAIVGATLLQSQEHKHSISLGHQMLYASMKAGSSIGLYNYALKISETDFTTACYLIDIAANMGVLPALYYKASKYMQAGNIKDALILLEKLTLLEYYDTQGLLEDVMRQVAKSPFNNEALEFRPTKIYKSTQKSPLDFPTNVHIVNENIVVNNSIGDTKNIKWYLPNNEIICTSNNFTVYGMICIDNYMFYCDVSNKNKIVKGIPEFHSNCDVVINIEELPSFPTDQPYNLPNVAVRGMHTNNKNIVISDPSQNKLYICNMQGLVRNTISGQSIDMYLHMNNIVGFSTIFEDIVIDHEDIVYAGITGIDSGLILVIDSINGTLKDVFGGFELKRPRGMVILDGLLYVCDYDDHSIKIFDTFSTTLLECIKNTAIKSPRSIGVDKSKKNIVVTCWDNDNHSIVMLKRGFRKDFEYYTLI